MKRRILALFTMIFFLFSTSALAYQNNSYYNEINIGLENMLSSSINITLNGNYKVNGTNFSTGTSTTIAISGGKLSFKGIQGDKITFIPQVKGSTIRLAVGAKQYNYLGTMSFKISGSKILPINSIGVEDYLKGVVGYEMSNSYPLEALKAQAVAARNYALFNLGKHKSKEYDLCDTIDCQVYRGYNSNYQNVIRAVDETKGILLLHNEKLVAGYFASSNGGYTENSENVWSSAVPYLRAYKDDFDNQNWPFGDMVLKANEIETTLKSKGYLSGTDKFVKIDLATIKKYTSGRVSNIDVVYKTSGGSEKRKSLTKERARTFLSLPSAMYSVTYNEKDNTYIFSGKGYGHGLGMSQIGARNRANAGHKYDSILTFYYKNSYINEMLANIKEFISKDKVLVGDKILLDSKGQNGSGSGYLFKYVIEKNGKVIISRDYSQDSKIEFVPKEAGEYTAYLYLKDKLSKEEQDDLRSIKFKAVDPPPNNGNNQGISISLPLKRGMKGAGVEKLQRALAALGYYKGSIDGAFGRGTYDSVVSFQRSRGIGADGIVGKGTLNEINKALGGNNIPPVKPNPNPAPPPDNRKPVLNLSRTLKRGLKGDDVRTLQEILKNLGFYVGSLDGSYGTGTYNAVKNFQSKNGLGADGAVGIKTAAVLNSKVQGNSSPSRGESTNIEKPSNGSSTSMTFKISRVLKRGMKGDDVKKLQEALRYLNFAAGNPDGAFGAQTETALKSFQRLNGLTGDGIVGLQTAKKIDEVLKR